MCGFVENVVKAAAPIALGAFLGPMAGMGAAWGGAAGGALAGMAGGGGVRGAVTGGTAGYFGGEAFGNYMAGTAAGAGGVASMYPPGSAAAELAASGLGPEAIASYMETGFLPAGGWELGTAAAALPPGVTEYHEGKGWVDALGFPMSDIAAGAVNPAGKVVGANNFMASTLKYGPLALSGLSAGMGMSEAERLRKLSEEAARGANPFGPYRDQYAQQLSQLTANPGSITSYPGYQFGLDQGLIGRQRALAAGGYSGSGNEAIELDKYAQGYGSQFLNTEQQRLAGLAGAGISPNYSASLVGQTGAAGLSSQAMASLGYGLMWPTIYDRMNRGR